MSAPATSARAGLSESRRADQYGVRAYATVHSSLEAVDRLRQELGLPGGPPFPHSYLKASDEQTVVALAAVLKAMTAYGLAQQNFATWGVIAAPRFFGRLNATEVISRVEAGGASRASPFFVPHRSLHAVSGTISQALEIKGPNFGVGGGVNAPAEGLLTAITLLDEYELPGLWVVFTQCDPEPRPDGKGGSTVPSVCHAIALAFMPVAEDWHGLRLHLAEPDAGQQHESAAANSSARLGLFADLTHFVEQRSATAKFGTWSCSLKWGCTLQLTDES